MIVLTVKSQASPAVRQEAQAPEKRRVCLKIRQSECQRTRLAFTAVKSLKTNASATCTLQNTPLRGTKRLDFADRACAEEAK
jgi:hypothetical protein